MATEPAGAPTAEPPGSPEPLGTWRCMATPPGALAGPDALPADNDPRWLPASVPGTAAGALRDAGADRAGRDLDARDMDAEDWWFRTRFPRPGGAGPWLLRLGGLATIADVWLDGAHLLHSENMFTPHDVPVGSLDGDRELVIRCAALGPVLAQRRPRPRWKVARLRSQSLRWVRTTLLGRLIGWTPTPAPVGPWRNITLVDMGEAATPVLLERRLRAECDPAGPGGSVHLDALIAGSPGRPLRLLVGDASGDLEVTTEGAHTRVRGSVRLPEVRRWWPHTHGRQPRYPVRLGVGGHAVELGQVGFREVAVDRAEDGFTLSVNGIPVFCRGAYWTPPDPVGLQEDPVTLRAELSRFRDANLNMLRVGGETVYPSPLLAELLDEFGILLWQDCMFAFYDLPDEPEFLDGVRAELSANLGALAAHPCLAVISGGSEIEQQAAFAAVPADRRDIGPLRTLVPELAEQVAPGVPYLPSSPTGGALPVQPRSGVAHYYGVGAYLRPLEDARRAGVRFAAECLAFAVPPEPDTVETACGGAAAAGHDPRWKAAVYRDAGASWDFEDVTAHYTGELFGVRPEQVRRTDPERALDLARASVAHVHEQTWAEWRRAGSPCAGALVFHYRDLVPGAGLGVVDALGRPKAPWWVMRRALAPIAVLLSDEGLNGLDAHLINDTTDPVTGTLTVELFAGELRTESIEAAVTVPARDGVRVDVTGMFDGFRDLNHAYLFGPPAQDLVVATLAAGGEQQRAVYFVDGPARPVEDDLGLSARFEPGPDGCLPRVLVSARRTAQFVALDVPGAVASDNWFHLPPGESVRVALTPDGSGRPVRRGRVRALNQARAVTITPAEI